MKRLVLGVILFVIIASAVLIVVFPSDYFIAVGGKANLVVSGTGGWSEFIPDVTICLFKQGYYNISVDTRWNEAVIIFNPAGEVCAAG